MSSNSLASGSAVVARPTFVALLLGAAPGLALCGAVAGIAMLLHALPLFRLFSPMIVAVVAGMALGGFNLVPRGSHAGLSFAARPLLRLAIILLGFQLTWPQIQQVGLVGTVIIVLSLTTTMLTTIALAKLLKIDRKLAQLIAVGTSICGASAIVAANSVTHGSDEDVAYALACVTFCGTIAMFVFPLILQITNFSEYQYGLWSGAAIHEVGQVVGAAFQGGQVSGEFGTIAKLTRVALLAPVIVVLGFGTRGSFYDAGAGHEKPARRVPPFILLFLVVVAVNSTVDISANLKSAVATTSTIMLTMALAATGLTADVRKLRKRGMGPFALGVAASVIIAAVSFGLLKLMT
jgi:uncharacterized integral membrane protein (TIGR00698 family)